MRYRTFLVSCLIALIVVSASVIGAGPMGNFTETGRSIGQNLWNSDSGQGTSGQGITGDQTINRYGFSLETAGKGTLLQTRICDMQCLHNQTCQRTGSNAGSGDLANRYGFSLETAGKGTMLQTRSLDIQSVQDKIRNQTPVRNGSCGNCITI
jgi:hypothetical protein